MCALIVIDHIEQVGQRPDFIELVCQGGDTVVGDPVPLHGQVDIGAFAMLALGPGTKKEPPFGLGLLTGGLSNQIKVLGRHPCLLFQVHPAASGAKRAFKRTSKG